MNPAKVLALGFLIMILIGALLLSMPFAAEKGITVTPFQALFTATSAVCVTGLKVIETATSYSLFGELIILCLIQLGGLGFMLFATSVLVLSGKRITLRNRMLLHETMSIPGLSGTVRLSIRFVLIVISVEIVGSIILAIRFVPIFGLWKGIYYGVFHAVSAFCNAGFDLFGAAGSLTTFFTDPSVLLTVAALIVIGGLGFAVLADIQSSGFRFRKLNLHSKIAIFMTGLLLISGLVFFTGVEWNNAGTLSRDAATTPQKLLNAFFQSVTTRTAGFNAIPQNNLSDAGKLFSILLMFVGASPASTGGGIKTTTIFVIFVLIKSVFKGRDDVYAFKKRLPLVLIRTSISIFFLGLMLLAAGLLFMEVSDQMSGFSSIDLLFEEASALGTIGLSVIGPENLTRQTQVWLMLLMFFGRVGPLTMMLSLTRRRSGNPQGVRYPEEQIIVG